MEFEKASNRVWKEDRAQLIAEITFPLTREGIVNFNHTFVDTSLRGQGIAEQLLLESLDIVRKSNWKAIATCPYVIKWFDNNPEVAAELLVKR